MRRLSSQLTVFYKKVFPVIWVGFLIFYAVVVGAAGPLDQLHVVMGLVTPALMLVFGYILFRFFAWPLVDEVWLDGDHLVIRNRGREDRLALSQIGSVTASQWVNPERITLHPHGGAPIKFCAPLRMHFPMSQHPLAEELRRLIAGS
jgi:hypothetical protein